MKQPNINPGKSSEDPIGWILSLTGIVLLAGAIATVVIDALLSDLPPDAPQVPVNNPGDQSEFTAAPQDDPSLG